MQANFIESNPLPVKAVLAMMGKIEEVYRLPLLPMGAIPGPSFRRSPLMLDSSHVAQVRSRRLRENTLFTRTGLPVRTKQCCTAAPADNAMPERDARRDTTRIIRAGMVPMAI